MTHSLMTQPDLLPNRRRNRHPRPKSIRKRPETREQIRLIEETRQLMERSIEFVNHPLFRREDVVKRIQTIRPDSIDTSDSCSHPTAGLAFVAGFVDAPLLTAQEEQYCFVWMNFLKFRAERNRRLLDLKRPDATRNARIISDLDEALRVRNPIVQSNLRLIVALARKLAGSVDAMSELISEGIVPLIRSVELFDINLGNRFSTYATWAVRNQMLRVLSRKKMLPEFFIGEDAPSLENLPDRRPLAEIAETACQQRAKAVNRLLSSLSNRERLVIAARFGLEGHPDGQSLAAIAHQIGLSKERVRQIVISSLSRLREEMSFEELEGND